MPLTPIHIRGKKRTADKVSSAAPNSSAGPASPAAAGKEVMAPKKKSGRAESSRRVSILERLPVELLVMVFTESQNMDLQFCSRHIHTALNNYYSHVRLVARAFAPTWSMNHGKRRSKLVEAANPPVPAKEFQDIVRYQEKLIHKKFFNIDIILDAQQIWIDTYQPENKRIHHLKQCNPGGKCDHCKGGLENHVFNARECFEHDFRLAKAWVNKKREGWKRFRNRQDVQLGVQLQPKMLRGKWDEKYEKLIFWLVAGGAFVDHENWDPQHCYAIVYSHTDVSFYEPINAFFTYGAMDLVNFTHWPLQEAYQFYLSNKPEAGTNDWIPERRKFHQYLSGTFDGDDLRAIRYMRREYGRDVNDSDLPYDSANDSGEEW